MEFTFLVKTSGDKKNGKKVVRLLSVVALHAARLA
jgi:hypothetical protein